MSPLFYLLAAMTLGGAVAAMTLRNPVHCALCLVVTFVGLAGVFLGLGAEFLGLAQVLVYVGAVAILLVFVLLLTRSEDGETPSRWQEGWRWGAAGGVAVTLVLVAVVLRPGLAVREVPAERPGVVDLGEALMTDYVLPLQVVGVLLTASMIGAAIIALRPRGGGAGRRDGRDG
ncbi:MAG: NADH-quinone oxidoreductase subunit J [Verrucomicrobiae bacterium]|nr:NADH-quinone oxidoreductase subunit J [Verrucomicrobiae bacterium]